MISSPDYSESPSPWAKRLKRLKRYALVALVILVGGVIGLEIIIQSSDLPESINEPLEGTPVLHDQEGGILAMLPGGPARTRLVGRLSGMGRWLPEVTVNLEDHRFYDHPGVDLYAIGGAAWSDIRAGRIRRGASTVTQQLIKQDLGKRGRQWKRKWREAILALKLERSWPKNAILEGYLNRLDYGNRRFGAESASLAYFGKRCSSLTLGEAIYLAGLPQAPTRYNPWRNPQSALRKYARSIDRLTKVGYLTDSQAIALRDAPPLPGRYTSEHRSPHYIDALRRSEQLPTHGAMTTSLDPGIQKQAHDVLASHLTQLNRQDVRNGAIVIMENITGHVLGLSAHAIGSAADTLAINAALTPRHAGSTLKPFVYQLALEERRHTTASILTDTAEAVTPIYPDYDPKNFNKRTYGPVRLREALGNSLNIPAILVSHAVGSRRAFARLAEWGLKERDPFGSDGAGFVLGNRRVTLLELTFAYSTLARRGLATDQPHFRENAIPALRRIAESNACALIEDILCDNSARAQSFGAQSVLRFPANQRTAVKTGTSSNFRDAWVMGYNATHTVGVWIGNLDGRGMKEALSVKTAGPVWRLMMDWLAIHRESRSLAPTKPSTEIVSVTIDALTGLLPTKETRQSLTEWFIQGTEPMMTGESWYQDGKIVLPEAYRTWCQSPDNRLGAKTASALEPRPWTITSPKQDAHFVMDRALPREQQVLPIGTDHPEAARLHWYLNDQPLVISAPIYWPLTPGAWKLRAHDPETGREARADFVVEP
ncbi:MAG: penicillin-binding protein 1C [Verrucomicrobiales bacterium]|jgi:penicillin-binding protein 1C